MMWQRTLITLLTYLLLAIFEALLLYDAFETYQTVRLVGPDTTVSVYGKFGWGTSPVAYAFVTDTLLAGGIVAFVLNSWWRDRPIVLSGERMPYPRRATTCSRRKAQRRRRSHR